MSPIPNRVLFGINWTWPSSHMFSSHLSDVQIHYNDYCTVFHEDIETRLSRATYIPQLLGMFINLRTLTLELELSRCDDTMFIELPNLHSLSITSTLNDILGCRLSP